jgi:hypothetical protein
MNRMRFTVYGGVKIKCWFVLEQTKLRSFCLRLHEVTL